MNTLEIFDQYLKKAQSLSIGLDENPNGLDELLTLIETSRKECCDEPHYESIFLGESAFYTKKYEVALKHYLGAAALPYFQFFCYRTSAHLFYQLGNKEKAIGYAEKALKIFPFDYPSLILLENALDPESEEFIEIQKKIKNLESSAETTSHICSKNISIGKKEIEELAHIFEEHNGNEEELFAEECCTMAQPERVVGSNQNKRDQPMEFSMNTESDIFSSPKNRDVGTAQSLTERLYSSDAEGESNEKYQRSTVSGNMAFEELKKFAGSSHTIEREATNRFIANELGNDLGTTQVLEQRVKAFQTSQAENTRHYLEQAKARAKNPDCSFYYLNGWNLHPGFQGAPSPYIRDAFLTERTRKTTGGIFLRWNDKGIAINPGQGFLKNFHEQGLHIHDIDFIIVTSDQHESYAEVKEIYDLNYQLNKLSPELKIIHYYFNHKAFQEVARILKPHFKQERNTIHSLELFMDSPDVEKIELSEGITLNYFQAFSRDPYSAHGESREERAMHNHSCLGIRLELKALSTNVHERISVRIGILSHIAWNPLLAHHLGSCDILVAGFGNTSSNDYNKISYNQDSLGYYGTYTLLEEIAPKILLSGEFGGSEGDLRLEAVHKMRQEYYAHAGRSSRNNSAILPADTGLFLDLKTLQVRCSVCNTLVEPSLVKVVKTANAFGKLEYLSPSCCY